MKELFLGLDCSTQGLTAVIVDFNSFQIIYKNEVNYDKDLAQYNTQNGVYINDDGITVHSNPIIWTEALDLLFHKMLKDKVAFNTILAISGSAQQHGTVYLNDTFEKRLQNLHPDSNLRDQILGSFSRKISPVWMDSSTSQQCQEIREKLGGIKKVIKLTGSNTIERFSGPQIRKFYQDQPEQYYKTNVIHLISSYMASLLLGKSAPIDHGDGAGMNLMNIATNQWDQDAIEATAPNLRVKLPSLVKSQEIIGKIAPYFTEKYGFSPNALLIAWSGDNPNSLIGVGLTSKGKVAISLGTSDTYFGYMEKLYLDFKGEGHVFGAPTGDYMSLICFKNGSLAREEIKNQFSLTWKEFSDMLLNTPPGNNGNIMLPYFFPEIVPLVLNPKVYRFGFDENNPEINVRAIVEAQLLSMKLHSRWIGEKASEIHATGGTSINTEILQVAADIFNLPVRIFELTNSAALGAAIRSAKSFYDSINQNNNWTEINESFLKLLVKEILYPNENVKELYEDMLLLYEKYEDYVLRGGENPEPFRQRFKTKCLKRDITKKV
ncbi:MAG: xylulokinase [Promethearchaeota archaeon]